MPVLNDADDIFVGSTPSDEVYSGTSLVWSRSNLDNLDPDTKAYLAATGLDPYYAQILDNLIVGLKDYNLRQKMVAAYAFIGGTADLHKWNLWDPRDRDDAYRLTFYGGWHSLENGYTPNTPSDVVNTGYSDSHCVPLGTLTQDSTHLSYYSLQNMPVISRAEMGCFNWTGTANSRFHIIAHYAPGDFYYGMSEEGFTHVPMSRSDGLFTATRTGPTHQAAYRNGARVGEDSTPSVPLPPVPIWVGGINTFSDRTDLPCGFASIGSGFSDQNAADLYTVVQNYQNELGRATS
jgi:hypothetical protein